METLLTVQETAARLRVSRSFIYLLVDRRKIPHMRLGSRLLFSENRLDEWVQEQMQEGEGLAGA